MRRLCTICARGGSKGVPNKNLRPLLGKPMLVHTIECAQQSAVFERIAVSSDSNAILALAKASGVDDLIERPAEMATDEAAKCPAIRHALLVLEARHSVLYDTQVDLDVTSPLRVVDDIRGAVQLLERQNVSSVITGSPSRHSPYFNLVEESLDGHVDLAKRLPTDVVRRQDVPRTYDMDGSIYVWKTSVFRDDPKVFYSDTILFELPPERSRDVDSELDFLIVETLMKLRNG